MKQCSHCAGGGTAFGMPCAACEATGKVPDDAPDADEGWAHYCHECGFLKTIRDGARGEGSWHVLPGGERHLAMMQGFGKCIEQGLRAIAGWPTIPSDPAVGDVLNDSAEAPETAPEEPRPAAGSGRIAASACSVCRANGELCVYCEDRITGDKNGLHEYTEFWEHPSTLTALPVIDEDGDAWATAAWES